MDKCDHEVLAASLDGAGCRENGDVEARQYLGFRVGQEVQVFANSAARWVCGSVGRPTHEGYVTVEFRMSEEAPDEEGSLCRKHIRPHSEFLRLAAWCEGPKHIEEAVVSSHAKLFSGKVGSLAERDPGAATMWALSGQVREPVNQSGIAMVTVRFLRELRRKRLKLPRCQELRPDQYSDFIHILNDNEELVAVSHPWLARDHPDPTGAQLVRLVDTLDQLGARDEVGVFYDFCSVPQEPMSREERQRFDAAMTMMDLVYISSHSRVVVLPETRGMGAETTRDYCDRGWCCFEFCISAMNDTIANQHDACVANLLQRSRHFKYKRVNHLSVNFEVVDRFAREFEEKTFTEPDDKQLVKDLFTRRWTEAQVNDILDNDGEADHLPSS